MLLACMSLAQQAAASANYNISLQDLVLFIPTSLHRHHMACTARYWAPALRRVIVTNVSAHEAQQLTREGEQYNELYLSLQTEPWHIPHNGSYRSWMHGRPGDIRIALGPALAHQALKARGWAYKFMLFGDDDTLWLLPSLLRLLNALRIDPALPVALSDNLWHRNKGALNPAHPSPEAVRCLPCGPTVNTTVAPLPSHRVDAASEAAAVARNAEKARLKAIKEQQAGRQRPLPYEPAQGCAMCSQAMACAWYWQNKLDCRPMGVHGGAGGVLSHGLMERMSLKAMTDCIPTLAVITGGDAIFSHCLWTTLKMGWTEPGAYTLSGPLGAANPNRLFFDPRPLRLVWSKPATRPLVQLVEQLRFCGEDCIWAVLNGVTMHISGKGDPRLVHKALQFLQDHTAISHCLHATADTQCGAYPHPPTHGPAWPPAPPHLPPKRKP
uniref:Uncharacterized protein n=1 Tax=Chlamydomonas leiostraca TaxID=1034604 RepID=A0A7S0WVN9_9CHLO